MNRRKMVLGMFTPLFTGLMVHTATRSPQSAAAAQLSLASEAVYFRTSATPKFRKIVVRFDISGTNHTISLGEATCMGESFTLSGTAQIVKDTVAGKTYVSAVYVPKTLPAGDAPLKSGATAAISVSITIDNNTTTPTTSGPVIDVDPCAVK